MTLLNQKWVLTALAMLAFAGNFILGGVYFVIRHNSRAPL